MDPERRGASRLSWLGPALVVLILGAVSWLCQRDAGVASVSVESVYRPRAEALRPIPFVPRPEVSSRAGIVATTAIPDEAAASDESAGTERTISGWVLFAATGSPVAHADVRLLLSQDPTGSRRWSAAVTDDGGAFALDVPKDHLPARSLVRARVQDRSGDLLFDGSVVFGDGLVIEVPEPALLSGRVRLEPPIEDPERIEAAAYLTRAEAGQAWLCGKAHLDGEGRFAIPARLSLRPAVFRLTFAAPETTLGSLLVPSEDLLSPEGADLELRLRECRLRVVDENGYPLPDAGVRVGAGVDGGDGLLAALVSNERGECTVTVAAEHVALCGWKEGYAFAVLRLGGEDGPEGEPWGGNTLVLHRLREGERVRGWVRDADGAPVAGAWVTLVPAEVARNVAVVASVQGRSRADGSFELAWPAGERTLVVAVHPDHGTTPEAVVVTDGRPLELRFPRSGAARIHLSWAQGISGAPAGMISFWLADRERTWSLPGWVQGPPIELEGLHEGDYNVYLRIGNEGYGEASFSVSRDQVADVTVPMRLSSPLEGVVVDEDGRPVPELAVIVRPPSWPEEVSAVWGRGRTDRNGRFRTFGAPDGEVELVVLEGARTLARRIGAPSDFQRIVVHRRGEEAP